MTGPFSSLRGVVCCVLVLPLALLCLQLVVAEGAEEKIVFYESFAEDFDGRWIVSETAKYKGPWKHSPSQDTEDYGLLASEKAHNYAIAAELPKPVDPKVDTLVLQYDVRLQSGLECGGAYLKFLMPQEAGWTPSQFKDDSPYSIMFGPDKCGATNKVHFIVRHRNPSTGKYVEHHLTSPPIPIADKLSHVYSAVIYPNNTVKILIDGEEKRAADLLSADDFEPPLVPPKTITDPDDKKPSSWDDRKKIPDPDATKPDDWDESAPRMVADEEATKPEGWLDDEPLEVDDPEAEKPSDWDEAEDGEWEAPKVPNPKCEEAPGCGEWKAPLKLNPAFKGKWSAPLIDNPGYSGVFVPRDIDNPEYFETERPDLETVAAVGIEIWTMEDGILFDNILVTHDEAAAAEYRETTWKPKHAVEAAAEKERRGKEEEEERKALPKRPLKDQIYDRLEDVVEKLTERPLLAPYRSQLLDWVETSKDYPAATFSILTGLFFVFVAIIYSLIPGKRKAPRTVPVGRAKKEDISTPDDPADAVADATVEKETVVETVVDKDVEPGTMEEVEVAAEVEEIAAEAEAEKPRRRTRRDT